MGPQPTQTSEHDVPRDPGEGGALLIRTTMDSRFRGNDAIFERVKNGREGVTKQ